MFAWDAWLEPVWEGWSLKRRQQARKRGKKFTLQENLDDFVEVLMNRELQAAADTMVTDVMAESAGPEPAAALAPAIQQQTPAGTGVGGIGSKAA